MRRGWLLAAWLVVACDDDAVDPTTLTWTVAEDEFWRDRRAPIPPGDRIVITNNLSDTISVLDLAAVGGPTVPELARVPVGLTPVEREGPHHLTADPDGAH